MDAVSFPQEEVKKFIVSNLIPLRVPYDAKPLSDDFNVQWTPTLLILDAEGREHQRTVGFIGPEDLVPSLLLGIGKVAFDRGEFPEALSLFEEIEARFPGRDVLPEAMFLQGVCRYKITKDPGRLKDAYERLVRTYPSSEWTGRASPYRLL